MIKKFLKRLIHLFFCRRKKKVVSSVSCSDVSSNASSLTSQFLYAIYDSSKEQFCSFACFPFDDAAVSFFVNCHLSNPSFPCFELYRVAIVNIETCSIESIDPISLHDSVCSYMKRSLKCNSDFCSFLKKIVSDFSEHDEMFDKEVGSDET